MNNSIGVFVLASAVAYGTPLLFAALGELLVRYRVRFARGTRSVEAPA